MSALLWQRIDAGTATLTDRYVVAHLIGVRNSPKLWTMQLERELRQQTELIELKRNELLLRRKIRTTMALSIPARLNALMGKEVEINHTTAKFIDWAVDAEGYRLVYEKEGEEPGTLKATTAGVASLLSTLEEQCGIKPATLPATAPAEAPALVPTATPASTLSEVSGMLLAAMRRVEQDPSFIPTAKALADTAQVITNVAKVQLEAIKAVRL